MLLQGRRVAWNAKLACCDSWHCRDIEFRVPDLAARLDDNPVRGRIPVADILAQLERGRRAYQR
jgi:hypothetical protein